MDSQLTLVDSTELPERYANTELVFDRDSLTNANLRVRGGHAVQFVIKTAGRSMSRTELLRVDPVPASDQHRLVPVVCIDRGEVLPDTISFDGGASVRVKKWLKEKGFSVRTADGSEVRYVWKPASLREIALYNEANPFSPVAWFRTAYNHEVDGAEVRQMPTLSLQPEAEAIQAYVMGSLLVVEQKYRMRSERSSQFGSHMGTISINGGLY